uniref:hypothetical protein n=1 Tax=uncultured Draconibacterium sp. TaxID=1573823 RepID=UPI0032177993
MCQTKKDESHLPLKNDFTRPDNSHLLNDKSYLIKVNSSTSRDNPSLVTDKDYLPSENHSDTISDDYLLQDTYSTPPDSRSLAKDNGYLIEEIDHLLPDDHYTLKKKQQKTSFNKTFSSFCINHRDALKHCGGCFSGSVGERQISQQIIINSG